MSRARSESGVASIHSSVSTSRALLSQSTFGTRKSGSSLVFSAISDSAAASSRKSISMVTERRKVSTTSMEAEPPRFGGKSLRIARHEREGIDIGLEAPLDAGPQHLYGDRAAAVRVATSARWTCAIEAAATAGPKLAKTFASGLSKAAAMARSASACGNGAILSCRLSRSRASATPTTSGRVARNWPSFT